MPQPTREHVLPGGLKVWLVKGDLTAEPVDAIVNAANAQLAHGGGVAGAIVRKGGRVIQDESTAWVREHGPVSPAQPAITGAGRLPCRFVIHAVGPVWGEGDEDAKLTMAVAGALALASRHGLTSIALPAISTGIFGFPKERAAGLILGALARHPADHPTSSLREVRIVLFDQESLDVFERAFDRIWPDSV